MIRKYCEVASLLVGVKSDKDENDDGDQFLLAEGMLPRDAILTEDSFMMQPYAENDGGSDTIDVPVTIFRISVGMWFHLINTYNDFIQSVWHAAWK